MYSVLLVDDDEEAVSSLAKALNASLDAVSLFMASDAETALQLADRHTPRVAVIDLSLNPEEGVESGFALLKRLQSEHQHIRVIVLTGHGDTSFGVRAIQLGASNFLVKPADVPHLAALVSEAASQYELLFQLSEHEERDIKHQLDVTLVGSSRSVQELKEQVRFAASISQPVLLEGETGVGKSLCARLIHRLSKRAHHPFVRYQPGLSRSDILASELFGHEKGSFTGAENEREGLLLRAHQGTFFLDEIDGLPPETQTSLLGVLQEKRFRKIGSDTEVQTNIRFLSATNAVVEELVDAGKVRSDFFHRVAHCRIRIPPLRERKEDIPLLTESLLLRLQNDEAIGFVEFTEDALGVLQQHDWPGNVRELEAVVEGAAARAQFNGRREVQASDLGSLGASKEGAVPQDGISLQEQVIAFKKSKVAEALAQNENNQVRAAKALGIDRTTLRRILQG